MCKCHLHTRIQPLDKAVLKCDKHERILFNYNEKPILVMDFNDLKSYTTTFVDPSAEALVDHIQMYPKHVAITFTPSRSGVYSCIQGDKIRAVNVTIDELVTMEVAQVMGEAETALHGNETIYFMSDDMSILLNVFTARGSPPVCVLSVHPVYGSHDSDLAVSITKLGEGRFTSRIRLDELNLTLPVKIGLHCEPWGIGVGDSRAYLLVMPPPVCVQPDSGPMGTQSEQRLLENDCQLLQLVTNGLSIISCWIMIATAFTLLYYKKKN